MNHLYIVGAFDSKYDEITRDQDAWIIFLLKNLIRTTVIDLRDRRGSIPSIQFQEGPMSSLLCRTSQIGHG